MGDEASKPQLCFTVNEGNSTCILLVDNLVNFYGIQKVTMDGSQKAPLQPLEQPKEEAQEISTSDWIHMGLAVASCIPVIGTFASLADAAMSIYEGHYLDAAVSLVAAIPFAGEGAAAAKLAARGGKLIAKAANVVIKGEKIAQDYKKIVLALRWLVAAKFAYEVLSNWNKIRQTLIAMSKGQFDWGDPKFWTMLFVGVASFGRGKITKGLNKKLGVGTTGKGIPLERVKPHVLEQIHPDENAAYGYSPNKGTAYEKYDFTDIEKAKQNRILREEYVEQSKKIQSEIDKMAQQGASKEEIANKVVEMRNQHKIETRAKMSPEELAPIEARNIKLYGNPVGPDAKWLFNDKLNKMQEAKLNPTDDEVWDSVIKGSMKKDDVINTLLGIEH